MPGRDRNSPVDIGGIIVTPGERVTIELPVADLYTHTSLDMPIHIICGRYAGPRLFVSAAIHGDELIGVEIIRRLLRLKVLNRLRGTLIAVPIVNVHGFLDQSRYLPDRRDLNRSFPGSEKGSVAARLAHTFASEIVAKADFGIDIHSGAIHRANLPQIRANLDDAATMELARVFDVPVLINANVRDGSLRECAAERGIPTLLYEAGEALRFDEVGIRAGVRGVINVMRQLGMLSPKKSKVRTLEPIIAKSTRWIRAPASGVVRCKLKLGQRVVRNDQVALISDPFGEVELEVLAPVSGIVIGLSRLPLAHEGDALVHLALFESTEQAETVVEEFQGAHENESMV